MLAGYGMLAAYGYGMLAAYGYGMLAAYGYGMLAAAVAAAANATADLLTAASAGACATLQVEIDTPWAGIARRRLTAAYTAS